MSTLPTICFLTGTLNAFAGAERMTAVIANALAERGYRVRVLSLWDRASAFPLHADVVHDALFESRPSFKRQYFATVRGIRRFVRQHSVDVLIEVDTMLTLFTLPATVGLKVRRIAWEHCHFDEDLGRRARQVARWLAARFDHAVVVLTERDRQRWLEALQPPGRVVTIPNPLSFPFPETPSARSSRVVLAVGRLVHAKGFDLLLNAWSQLAPLHPDWRLKIVGEGEERTALEALADSLGITDSVSLPGVCNDMPGCYREASIFCLSSRYEGFGLVLLEAMAFGLPVLSTDCETGPVALIRHGENGVLTPSGQTQALASDLSTLMDDKALQSRLSEASRQFVQRFDVRNILALWQGLLR